MAYVVNVPILNLGENAVFQQGELVDLPSGIAAKLISKAYIKFEPTAAQKIKSYVEKPVEKLIPDLNAEKTIKFVSTIISIETLEKMLAEEEADKNRKTVLEAIKNRVAELDEAETPEEGAESGINVSFNPEDVISGG